MNKKNQNSKAQFKKNMMRQTVKAKLKNMLQGICIDRIEIDDDFKIKGNKIVDNFTNPTIHIIEIMTLDLTPAKSSSNLYFLKIDFNDEKRTKLLPIGELDEYQINKTFWNTIEKYFNDLKNGN